MDVPQNLIKPNLPSSPQESAAVTKKATWRGFKATEVKNDAQNTDGIVKPIIGSKKAIPIKEIHAEIQIDSKQSKRISQQQKLHMPGATPKEDISSEVPLEEAQTPTQKLNNGAKELGKILEMRPVDLEKAKKLLADLKGTYIQYIDSTTRQLDKQLRSAERKKNLKELQHLAETRMPQLEKTREAIQTMMRTCETKINDLSMFKMLGVSESEIVFHDYTKGKNSGMFGIDNAIRDVENTFEAISKEALNANVERKLNGIKDKCNQELKKIPIPQRSQYENYEAYKKAMGEALHDINQVKANAFFQAAKELGTSTKVLEQMVNKFNSDHIGKQTVITKFVLDGVTYYDIAQPRRITMHTSADRVPSDISNSFKRSIYKLDAEGTFVPLHSGLQTNSSLPTISIGEMIGKEATKGNERYQGAATAFKQMLAGLEPQKNEKGEPLTDSQGHKIIKLSSITLFTPAKEKLDKLFRGMESEFLQLDETAFLYDLYDGQLVKLEDGSEVRVEIEHTNAGCNIWAAKTTFRTLFFDGSGMEKNINDKAMGKISSDVEKMLYPPEGKNPNIPQKLKADQESCQKVIIETQEKNSERLAELRESLEDPGLSEQKFKEIKQEVVNKNNELKAAYSKLAEVNKKIFNATLKIEKEILGENEKNLERAEKELEGLEQALKLMPNDVPLQNRYNKLIGEIKNINIRRLHLEIQDLYYNDKYRTPETLHNLQTALALLGELRNRSVSVNCKSGNDRTGRLCNIINLAWITYQKTGRFPDFSTIITQVENTDGKENPNTIFSSHKNHKKMHLFGAAAKVAGQNKPGSEFLQVSDSANPPLKGLASILSDCGVVKEAWKMAAEMEGTIPKEKITPQVPELQGINPGTVAQFASDASDE